MIKKKISYEIFTLLILTIAIFFLKNPLVNWLEGDFENIYFIYNTLLTTNSITPNVTDYPGNSSFSINSLYLKIISYFNKTILINLDDIILSSDPITNFNQIYKYLKYLQLFYSLIALICFYKILTYLELESKVALSLSLLLLISNQFLDNIQRYRFDFESLTFYLVSTFFLIYATYAKKKYLPICASGFFLCMSLFSKILTLPLFFIIPALFYFKKNKSLNFFIIYIFFNKETIFLFLIINFLTIIFSILYSFNLMYFITNNLIYVTFYFFFSEYFKSLKNNGKYKYLSLFILGILIGLIFMFSQALSLQKILAVSNPYYFFQHHSLETNLLSKNIFMTLKNMKFDFLEIILLVFSFFLIYLKKKNNLYLNLLLFVIYFLYKIILFSKGADYHHISTLMVLLIIVAINFQKSKYNMFIYSAVIFCFFFNFNNILDNNFNMKTNNKICELKKLNEKEYNELNKDDYYFLYYAPKISDYNFMKKLC